jgi:hypothetical protein
VIEPVLYCRDDRRDLTIGRVDLGLKLLPSLTALISRFRLDVT